MKKTSLILALVAICTSVFAQNSSKKTIQTKTTESGTVIYEQVVKLDIKLEGEAASFAHALPKERKSEKILYFNKESALYQNNKDANNDEDMENESGGVMIKMTAPDNKTFTDLKNEKLIEQRDFMTRMFLIEQKIEKSKWKLTGKQKVILGYSCQQALKKEEDKDIKVWFCPSIPISAGPENYGALPGLILEVNINDGKNIIKAKSIDLKPVDKKLLLKPKKGKKVSKEQYEKIVAEKMKEMGAEGGEGGNQVIIKIKR